MTKADQNIGVISYCRRSLGNETFLLDLVKILSPVADNLYVIAPDLNRREENNVHLYPTAYHKGENVFAQLLNQVSLQFRMSYKIARLFGKVDSWIFFDCEDLLLPGLTAKLSGSKLMFALAGSLENEANFRKNILNGPRKIFKSINFFLANKIVLYSSRLIQQWGLKKYKDKIVVADRHFVDLELFKFEKPIRERTNLVGYIGRLSPEKGILNFVEAISQISKRGNDVRFTVAGDGPLRTSIEQYCQIDCPGLEIDIVGWIDHDTVPSYLNNLKLLVLPSFTEGMPNGMLEAMACGTPVLATPVGAIPDVISDGETGFIMDNNSPECIAENIIRALNHPDYDYIARNAHTLMEREFTYEAAVKRYKKLLSEMV